MTVRCVHHVERFGIRYSVDSLAFGRLLAPFRDDGLFKRLWRYVPLDRLHAERVRRDKKQHRIVMCKIKRIMGKLGFAERN